jgi:hypothetical protein
LSLRLRRNFITQNLNLTGLSATVAASSPLASTTSAQSLSLSKSP